MEKEPTHELIKFTRVFLIHTHKYFPFSQSKTLSPETYMCVVTFIYKLLNLRLQSARGFITSLHSWVGILRLFRHESMHNCIFPAGIIRSQSDVPFFQQCSGVHG